MTVGNVIQQTESEWAFPYKPLSSAMPLAPTLGGAYGFSTTGIGDDHRHPAQLIGWVEEDFAVPNGVRYTTWGYGGGTAFQGNYSSFSHYGTMILNAGNPGNAWNIGAISFAQPNLFRGYISYASGHPSVQAKMVGMPNLSTAPDDTRTIWGWTNRKQMRPDQSAGMGFTTERGSITLFMYTTTGAVAQQIYTAVAADSNYTFVLSFDSKSARKILTLNVNGPGWNNVTMQVECPGGSYITDVGDDCNFGVSAQNRTTASPNANLVAVDYVGFGRWI